MFGELADNKKNLSTMLLSYSRNQRFVAKQSHCLT